MIPFRRRLDGLVLWDGAGLDPLRRYSPPRHFRRVLPHGWIARLPPEFPAGFAAIAAGQAGWAWAVRCGNCIRLCARAYQSTTARAFAMPRTRNWRSPRLRAWALTHSALAARWR